MAFSEDIASITSDLSRASIESHKSGRPRLDPEIRLLHRFYEPLVLLRILDPTRGVQIYNPAPDAVLGDSHNVWRKFLDQLSWICDFRQGGNTVSAVAAEATPSGPIFWLAANTNPSKKTIPHLEWILGQLESSHDASPQEMDELEKRIIARCINFSRDKVKNYSRILCDYVGKAVEIQAQKPNHSVADVQLLEDLQELEKLRTNHQELCSLSYNFRSFGSLQTLSEKHSTSTVPSVWSGLRHYIGRLGSWSKASKILVYVAKEHPQFICSFRVKYLVPPEPVAGPVADSMTTLHSALGRMFQKHESDRCQQVRETLRNWKLSDVSAEFLEEYTDKKFKPRVHAELLLLAHFYHRNLEFANNIKYIGCSKPSCYCCDLYIKCHPGKFNVRASHGNLWVSWRAPVPPLDDDKAAQEHTKKILNAMVRYIREDIIFQVDSKAPARPRVQDSTTGITTLATGPKRTGEENLSLLKQQALGHRVVAIKELEEYASAQQRPSGAPSLNLSATERDWIREDAGRQKVGEANEMSPIQEHDLLERELESSDDEIVVFRGRGKNYLRRTYIDGSP